MQWHLNVITWSNEKNDKMKKKRCCREYDSTPKEFRPKREWKSRNDIDGLIQPAWCCQSLSNRSNLRSGNVPKRTQIAPHEVRRSINHTAHRVRLNVWRKEWMEEGHGQILHGSPYAKAHELKANMGEMRTCKKCVHVPNAHMCSMVIGMSLCCVTRLSRSKGRAMRKDEISFSKWTPKISEHVVRKGNQQEDSEPKRQLKVKTCIHGGITFDPAQNIASDGLRS